MPIRWFKWLALEMEQEKKRSGSAKGFPKRDMKISKYQRKGKVSGKCAHVPACLVWDVLPPYISTPTSSTKKAFYMLIVGTTNTRLYAHTDKAGLTLHDQQNKFLYDSHHTYDGQHFLTISPLSFRV